MTQKISQRLLDVVQALPLRRGMRVLEIGCGSGVAAREIASRFDDIYVLGVDRSAKAIEQAKKNSKNEIKNGKVAFVQSPIENFALPQQEEPFDFAFAIRVGALDGRHPEIEQIALTKIANVLKKNSKLFIHGGRPLKEINLRL